MIGYWITMQIVDKKTFLALLITPFQLFMKFIIAEMVTKKGRENDIGRLLKCGFFKITIENK